MFGVDSREPGAVPRRALLRVRDDRPQRGLARGAQLVGRPRETRKQLREDLEEERKMPLPEGLVLGASNATLAEELARPQGAEPAYRMLTLVVPGVAPSLSGTSTRRRRLLPMVVRVRDVPATPRTVTITRLRAGRTPGSAPARGPSR